MTRSAYLATPGLSNSGMKDLAVSPLRYWYRHINPNRPEEKQSEELTFGAALHVAVLQPDQFDSLYACEVSAEDYPGALVKMDDLKDWLKQRGLPTSGKLKRELMDRVRAADSSVPILDFIEEDHAAKHGGKTILSRFDWYRVGAAANALRNEKRVAELLSKGEAEVPVFATDPETGVPLKACLDWKMPTSTMDLKTFSQKRAKTINETVANAIYYEGYHIQAFFYNYVRSLAENNKALMKADFIIPFVESDEPHETRIKVLQPGDSGEANLYWQKARIEVRRMIHTYADFMDRFGEKPWREEQSLAPLIDNDIRALDYGG